MNGLMDRIKHLSKRMKIILAVVAVLVVAAIAVGVMMPRAPRTELAGVAIPLAISPPNAVIPAGRVLPLDLSTVTSCDWTTSDVKVVSFYRYRPSLGPLGPSEPVSSTTGPNVDIMGMAPGRGTITATCGTSAASTGVQVDVGITPAHSTINVGQNLTLSSPGVISCTWTTSDVNVVPIVGGTGEVSSITGTAEIRIKGKAVGRGHITATCAEGNASASVDVQVPLPPTPTPMPVAVTQVCIDHEGTWRPPRYQKAKTQFWFTFFADSRGADYAWSEINVDHKQVNEKFVSWFANHMIESVPDLVLFGGDLANLKPAAYKWIEAADDLWNNGKVPLFAVLGNHELAKGLPSTYYQSAQEYWQNDLWKPYFEATGYPADKPHVWPQNVEDKYKNLAYSFVYGNTGFIFLDDYYMWGLTTVESLHLDMSYREPDAGQIEWFKCQMEYMDPATVKHIFVIGHAPVFFTNGDKVRSRALEMWTALSARNGDAYLTGDEHLYSIREIYPSIGNCDGAGCTFTGNIYQVISGAGGAPSSRDGEPTTTEMEADDWHAWWGPNTCQDYATCAIHSKRSGAHYSYLRVDINGSTATLKTKLYKLDGDSIVPAETTYPDKVIRR